MLVGTGGRRGGGGAVVAVNAVPLGVIGRHGPDLNGVVRGVGLVFHLLRIAVRHFELLNWYVTLTLRRFCFLPYDLPKRSNERLCWIKTYHAFVSSYKMLLSSLAAE